MAVGPRPTTLTLVHTRAPPAAAAPVWLAPTFPGFGLGMDGTPGGAPPPTPSLAAPSHTLKVECAWYGSSPPLSLSVPSGAPVAIVLCGTCTACVWQLSVKQLWMLTDGEALH